MLFGLVWVYLEGGSELLLFKLQCVWRLLCVSHSRKYGYWEMKNDMSGRQRMLTLSDLPLMFQMIYSVMH